jgi:mono/diheme cytochrome c family protein
MGQVITIKPFLSLAIVAVPMVAFLANANAQQIGSVREGRRLAHVECAQCHGVDRGHSTNPAAPEFDDIANVPE